MNRLVLAAIAHAGNAAGLCGMALAVKGKICLQDGMIWLSLKGQPFKLPVGGIV